MGKAWRSFKSPVRDSSGNPVYNMGMLKKSASGVLGLLWCSHTHLCAPRAKSPAALPEERCVFAHLGWVGETEGLFEQSLLVLVIHGIGESQSALKELRIIQQPQYHESCA